tara:strand:- start:7780 stop:8700 length:921 start_codon:yes stop_codon:yes gene_type:complete
MKKLLYISLITLIVSCSKDFSSEVAPGYDQMSDYMLAEFDKGAALRTISQVGEYQASNPGGSVMNWTLEPHDEQNGALTDNVEMYISYNGSFSGQANVSELLFKTIQKSEMYEGDVGLPRFDVSLSLNEAISALGKSGFGGGDIVSVRFVLNLTDGRSFSRTNVTGSMTGVYFRSPYLYPLIIGCEQPSGEIPAQAGTYTVQATDSWGDGWSTGEALKFTVDGKSTLVGNTAGWENNTFTFTIEEGAQTMLIEWQSGRYDDEVGFTLLYTNLAGKNQTVVSYGAYPNGASAASGFTQSLSGMSICY